MPGDTYDSILGFILQGDGNNNNSWGDTFNNSATKPIARAIAGVNTITSTGGTTDLSTVVPPAGMRLDIDAIQIANGTLTSDLTVQVTNLSKTWWFQNNTSGAFNMYVKVPSGASPNGLVQIPQGKNVRVMCDGAGNLVRHDKQDVGTCIHHFGTTLPAGAFECTGQSLVRTEFPDLFNAIGTTWGSVDGTHFTLPLLTDTNRFLRSRGGTVPIGLYQANCNAAHTHNGSGTTSTESVQHQHTFSGNTGGMSGNDPHSHTTSQFKFDTRGNGTGAGFGFYSNGGSSPNTPTDTTSIAHNHTFSGTTSSESVSHTHTYSFTTSGGSADGNEARPESAAVMICIRY